MEKRDCRACGQTYDYPIPKGLATRFYCEECVEIPVHTRRVLETVRRRLDRMSRRIDRLEETTQRREGDNE